MRLLLEVLASLGAEGPIATEACGPTGSLGLLSDRITFSALAPTETRFVPMTDAHDPGPSDERSSHERTGEMAPLGAARLETVPRRFLAPG